MKLLRKVLSAAAALCVIVSAVPAAFAEEGDARFDGKTWEEAVDQFIADREVDRELVALGYLNLVTGEEHYVNGDKYMIAASLYKVPLNMYYNDLVYAGEMDWDTAVGYDAPYEHLLQETIVNSNNEMAGALMQHMGGYSAMRKMFCQYMGEDEETVDADFLTKDYFSPRQMLTCLKLLYDNPDRYSKIIDYMKQAEPSNYFKFNEQEFEVAHKYGFDRVDFHEYVNDCAIVYTDEPIAIVMLSDRLTGGYNTMSQFCTLMSDYAQYSAAHRQAEETQAKEETVAVQREEADASTPQPIVVEKSDGAGFGFGSVIAAALAIAVAVAGLMLVLKLGRAGKLDPFWGAFAVLLALLAVVLCIVGSAVGTVVAKPQGDPQRTVADFFDAVSAGEYENAYALLQNCNSLGLENTPSTASGVLVHSALQKSYSYELYGQCVMNKMTAYQQLRFEYLDLPSFESDVQTATTAALKKLVQSRPRSQVYNANNEYLPEISQEAYSQAVSSVLEDAQLYYTSVWLTVELNYSDGRWLIVTDPAMLKALIGGVAY